MIHTLELNTFLYSYEAKEIKEISFNQKPQQTEYSGIKACVKRGYKAHKWLSIILNLHELVEVNRDDRIILTPSEIKKAIEIYNKAILELTPERIHHKVSFDRMHLKRTDYAIDLDLTEDIQDAYINLIKKGDIDKPTRDRIGRWDNLHAKKTTIGINIYNRAKMFRDKGIFQDVPEHLKVLRFEMQDKDPDKHDESQRVSEKLPTPTNTQIVTNILNSFTKTYDRCVGKYVGSGTFYSLQKAKELINTSELKPYQKADLKGFLDEVSKHKSIYNIKELSKEIRKDKKLSDHRINKVYEPQLNDLGIAWVPIPDSWGIESLKSLWEYFDEKMEELHMKENYPELY